MYGIYVFFYVIYDDETFVYGIYVYHQIYDENDEKFTIPSGLRARFVITTKATGGTDILDVDTGSEITVVTATSLLRVQMTQVQADALVAGRYLGGAAVEVASNTWRKAQLFHVRIIAEVAAKLANL